MISVYSLLIMLLPLVIVNKKKMPVKDAEKEHLLEYIWKAREWRTIAFSILDFSFGNLFI